MDKLHELFNPQNFPEGSALIVLENGYAVTAPTIPVTLATDEDPLTAIEKAKRKLGDFK